MKVYTTPPLEDPRKARTIYKELEDIGYDGGFSFEAKHDPFLTLAVAAEHTSHLRLGTGIAIAFARNPMNLANLGYDMQSISGGRFVLGLGSQVKPHIEKRFSGVWSHPAERMTEIVKAIKAIWACWEGKAPLKFEGRFYRHTIMIPAFNPGPNPYGLPPIFTGGFGPLMTAVAGEAADGFIAHPFNSRRIEARCAQAARLLRVDAGLPSHPRLSRLGKRASGAEPPFEGRPLGRHDESHQ